MREQRIHQSLVIISLIAGLSFVLFIVVTFIGLATILKDDKAEAQASRTSLISTTPATENVPGLLDRVNQFRINKGLLPVRLDEKLEASATAKANDLVQNNYWGHYRTGKTPWDFFDAAHYDYVRAGENLARCWQSTDVVVPAWAASPKHNEVMSGQYVDVGFGIAHSSIDDCDYVVAHFGTTVQYENSRRSF